MAKYGADTVRLYILYRAPPNQVLEWDEQSIVGMQRWLAKISRLVEISSSNETKVNDKELQNTVANTIESVA